MADALDLNLKNKGNNKDNKYDLDNTNIFEIVTLLDEKKFKNRSEFAVIISSRKDNKNSKKVKDIENAFKIKEVKNYLENKYKEQGFPVF